MPEIVFISHATQDREIVESEIIPALTEIGMSCWYSREQIHTAHDFQQKIRDALDRCEWFLVALTPQSVDSDWVRAEVLLAIERVPDRIIPVLVEQCDPSRCHMKLMLYQYVDWRGDSEQAYHHLSRAFQSALGEMGPSSNSSTIPVVDRLRRIRETRDANHVNLVFRSLADSEEGVRIRARQALHAIGWKKATDAVERLAQEGNRKGIDDVLVGLAALESHTDVVALLDRMVNRLSLETRNRAILLLERKTLSLRLEHVSEVLRSHHSPLVLEKVLGQGLTTATFLARNTQTGLQVVVRMLRPEFASQPDLRIEFMNLINRTCSYVHENLVLTRDGGQFPGDNFYFCVRDYIPGGTLQDVMNKGETFSPGRVLEMIHRLATAIGPIHQAGDCHRGIKPSNVFLSVGDRVILGDACLPVSLVGTNMNRLAYDFRYAAPENFQSEQIVGPCSDFYSMGCLFYELVTGKAPFVFDSPFELALAHRTESVALPSSVIGPSGKWADDLVLLLLARDADKRPRDVAGLLKVLANRRFELEADPSQSENSQEPWKDSSWESYATQYSIAGFHNPGDVFNTTAQTHDEAPKTDAEPFNKFMPKTTLEEFLYYLTESNLFTSDELNDILQRAAGLDHRQDGKMFADQLIVQSLLTVYQARAIYQRQPGRLVIADNYIIQDLIGAGGMGMVFKALHRKLGRIVALKILSRHARNDQIAITRFSREIAVAAKLSHSNVVSVSDAGEHDGVQYLVMEFIDGTDFGKLVQEQGPLAVEHAIDFAIQAATGLQHAHGHHVIHRDIKPDNLLLDQFGCLKILDMGLAQIKNRLAEDEAPSLTIQGGILGTVDFMAPEQATDTTQADARSDIYSLGCTLYFFLTGQPVFRRNTPMATMIAHREEPVPSLNEKRKDVPIDLDSILQCMLAKDPKKRYQTMLEVIHALKSLP